MAKVATLSFCLLLAGTLVAHNLSRSESALAFEPVHHESLVVKIKKKNKKNDDAAELTNCTIGGADMGGGCKSGLKWVCQKLKGGKKCCGCVVDKSIKKCQLPGQVGEPPNCKCPQGTELKGSKGCMPEVNRWVCEAKATGPGLNTGAYDAVSEGDAVTQFVQEMKRLKAESTGPITCTRK